MHVRNWTPVLVALMTCAAFSGTGVNDFAYAQGRGTSTTEEGRGRGQAVTAEGRDRDTAGRLGFLNRRMPRRYQEPAFARGYADGHERGLADGKARDRYDTADSRAYRDGDRGYSDSYGSRHAYRINYRAGFRQGYEEGYREATR